MRYSPSSSSSSSSCVSSQMLSDILYDNDLQLANNVENPVQITEKYVVAELIKPVMNKKVRSYLVRWRHFPSKKDFTVEPRSNLLHDVPKMVKLYEKRHGVVWKATSVSYDP